MCRIEEHRCNEALRTTLQAALLVAVALMMLRVLFGLSLRVDFSQSTFLKLIPPICLAAALTVRIYAYFSTLAACFAIFEMSKVAMFLCTAGCLFVGRTFPMADMTLASIDEAMGFHWVSYLYFIDNHAWIDDLLLRPAYLSIYWQPVAAALFLPLVGRGRDALVLMLSLPAGIMLVSIIAVFVPAYGTYHFYGVVSSMHPHLSNLVTADGTATALDWLRSETRTGPLPQDHGGLIAFPSFHTTAALLLIWSFRGSRHALYFILPLNLMMIAATPLHGSHYLADMMAGASIAPPIIVFLEALLRTSVMPPLLESTPAEPSELAVAVRQQKAHFGM